MSLNIQKNGQRQILAGDSNDYYGSKESFEAVKDTLPIGSSFDIFDDPSGDSPSQEIYDGEEHVIGTWFGETLYRKAINLPIINGSVAHGIANIKNIIRYSGCVDNGISFCNSPGNSAWQIVLNYIDTINVNFAKGSSQVSPVAHLIIDYTKVGD